MTVLSVPYHSMLLRRLRQWNRAMLGTGCIYRVREALARSCGFFLRLALIGASIWRALLHCGISVHRMSALGQERRIGAVRNISALPPRADVGADIVERPVSARKRHMHRSNSTAIRSPHRRAASVRLGREAELANVQQGVDLRDQNGLGSVPENSTGLRHLRCR